MRLRAAIENVEHQTQTSDLPGTFDITRQRRAKKIVCTARRCGGDGVAAASILPALYAYAALAAV